MFNKGNTEVVLFKNCPITPTNQIDFQTVEKQKEYFNTLQSLSFAVPFKYIDRGSFKVNQFVDDINNYNYGYYVNNYNGNTKRFYFYISSFSMVGSNTTRLTITIDPFQTYLFDFHFNQCFIEREHVTDDTIGKNVISEGLETGEYINLGKQYIAPEPTLVIVCGVADADNGVLGGIYNGFYQGLKYYACSCTNFTKMNDFIKGLCEEGHADTIVNMFITVKSVVEPLGYDENGGYLSSIVQRAPEATTYQINSPTSISGYKPYNKKCFTYPYTMLSVRNWNGCTHVLRPEFFADFNAIEMNFETAFSSGAKAVVYPRNYSGMEDSNMLDCDIAVTTSWASDVYANWYAQNQPILNATSKNAGNTYVNGIQNSNISYEASARQNDIQNTRNTNSVAQAGINGAINSMGALASLDVGGTMSGIATTVVNGLYGMWDNALSYEQSKVGYTATREIAKNSLGTTYENEIRSLMATNESHSIAPCEAKGDTTSCGLDFVSGRIGFVAEWKGMQYDNARAVDTFFQMYGYKVNRVGIPYTKNRKYWNYVKTMGCQLCGEVPRDDLEKISAMFDNGVTLWHWNGSDVGMFNYNRENTIVGTTIVGKIS